MIRIHQSPQHRRLSLLATQWLIIAGLAHTALPVLAQTSQSEQDKTGAQAIETLQLAQAPTTDTATEKKAEKPIVLQAVTVRSRNRIEKLQDVPLSISVVTGQELERLQALDVASFSKRVGNVIWNPGNPRQFSLSVRGIGKQAQTDAQDPSVGIIVDGVNYAYNPLSSSVNFTDIAAVEVTRGPQGTLLGKNTSLGVINITTRRPTFTREAYATVSYGDYHDLFGSAVLGGAVIDDLLAWRGVFTAQKANGDLVNTYNQDQTYANKDRLSARVQFLLTPSEDFSARISLDAQPKAGEATNGRSFNKPTPTTYASNNLSGPNKGTNVNPLSSDAKTRLNRRWFLDQSDYRYEEDWLGNSSRDRINADNYNPIVTGTNGASTELNWKLSNYEVTSITAYKDYYFAARNDEGTPFDISKNGGGLVDYKQYSQELRLSSKTGGFVDYQTGLFWLATDIDHATRAGWGSDAGAWFASSAQYTSLDATSSGRTLLQDSLTRLNREQANKYENESAALFAQANWHLSEPLTLTTGVRLTREDRDTSASALITDNGAGSLLNPSGVNVVNNVNLGGFDSLNAAFKINDTTTIPKGSLGRLQNNQGVLTFVNDNSAEQLAVADKLANKYFGAAITTPGAAYNSLTNAQKAQVADAKTIRRTQAAALWNTVEAESFEDTQPAFVVSPTYKFNDKLTVYASWQYGEKAGISQVVNGYSYLTDAEKSSAYEIGVKTVLLDNTLVFNADIFLTNIKDYQQAVRAVDEYTTDQNTISGAPEIAYLSYTGNVPKVRAQGLEIDGIYSGIPNTTIRFSGAYNDAYYVDFPNSAQPVENGYQGAQPSRDISGETLPGAFKYSFNLGIDYRVPVFTNHEFHTSVNTSYNSKFNSDNALSSYGWVDGSTTTDFAIGLGKNKGEFDVSLVVKNLFEDDTYQNQTWNSWSPALPRTASIVLSGKF
ncbi:MAG TPA: TonB-dependent receptor [Cellvibrio sp.]